MPQRRRERRRRGAAQAQPNLFSRLVPDVIEKPLEAGIKAPLTFTGNLLGDIKDAAVGLPMGLVALAKDPIASSKAIGGSVWHTWSPLFHGDLAKFGKQVYDHPLAPILDVAAVFTLGAGASARVAGGLVKAGATGSKTRAIAGLRTEKTVPILDPLGVGADTAKTFSTRAGRRLVQEAMLKFDGHLPQWYTVARYNRAHLVKMAHGAVVKEFLQGEALRRGKDIEKAIGANNLTYLTTRLQMNAIVKGAEALEDVTELGKRARSAVVSHMWTNLVRHNKAYDVDTAKRLVEPKRKSQRHYGYIKSDYYLDSKYAPALARTEKVHAAAARRYSTGRPKLERQQQRWEGIRDKNKAQAEKLPEIEKDLADASNELQKLRAEGHVATRGTEAALPWAIYVRELRAEKRKAVEAKAKRDHAIEQIEHLKRKSEGWDADIERRFTELEGLRGRSTEDFFNFAGETYEGFQNIVNSFGRTALTTNIRKALRRPDGKVYVAPLHDAYNLAYEGGNSIHFLHKLLHKPTMMWKRAVLLYTPRIITNNAIGNWFIYATRNADPNGIRAVYHTLIERYGKTIAGEPLFPKNHWLWRYFSDELAANFGVGNELVRFGDELGVGKRAAGTGFYGIQYLIAEKPVRASAIRKALYDSPLVKNEVSRLRQQGLSGRVARDRAIENMLKKHPELRDRAALESRRIAGDYVTLTETEKFLRDIIPFYLWQRHILKTTGNMLLEQPGRLALGARISDLGVEQTEALAGKLPEFLKGAIPLAALGLGDKVGRANLLLTSSLNPYATVGEMAEGLEAFLTTSHRRGAVLTGAGVNPFITGAIESATEKSLLTGLASPRTGGVGGDLLSRMLLALPHIKAADALASSGQTATAKGNPFLFARDKRSPLTWLTGLTVRDVNRSVAEALAARETGQSGKTRRVRRRKRRGS